MFELVLAPVGDPSCAVLLTDLDTVLAIVPPAEVRGFFSQQRRFQVQFSTIYKMR